MLTILFQQLLTDRIAIELLPLYVHDGVKLQINYSGNCAYLYRGELVLIK